MNGWGQILSVAIKQQLSGYGAAFCNRGLFNYSMWWEKRARGAVHRPHRLSVSLTRKPHHALFIMCTHILSLSLSRTCTRTFCMPWERNETKIDAKAHKCMSTKQAIWTKECEASVWKTETERGEEETWPKQYLYNRPHAKIIQAWSEINVRAWKLWRNPMPSCGPERQNKDI